MTIQEASSDGHVIPECDHCGEAPGVNDLGALRYCDVCLKEDQDGFAEAYGLDKAAGRAEASRALQALSEEQEDELDGALWGASGSVMWSSARRREWLYREAIRRGFILGPA